MVPHGVPIPESNTCVMVNGKFVLRVLENSNPSLCVAATSIAPYVMVFHFVICLPSNLFSVSFPGREDVAAFYQKGTIYTTRPLNWSSKIFVLQSYILAG